MMMHSFGLIGFFLPVLFLWAGGYFVYRILNRRSVRRTDAHTGRTPEKTNAAVEIFRLAKSHGGTLTVSDVVVESGLPPEEAEALLQSMADGIRVRMELSDDGTVRYLFPEITTASSAY